MSGATATTPDVSVVVAMLDEERTIADLVERTRAALDTAGLSFEIVLVDDGSRDRTVEIARSLEADDERVRVFEFTRNFGQAAALACGIFAARGNTVVQMDGDLQNPPEEIPALLAAIGDGAAIANGRRGQRYEGFARWLGSRAIHRLARVLTGSDIDDFGGNFKAYRRDVVDAVAQVWAPGKPLFALAVWLGFPVVEVTVRHDPPFAGRSRYTLRALLRINVDLITAFTTLPLAILGLVGLASSTLGLAGAVVVAVTPGAGWYAGAVALTLCIVGAIFIAAGVLGQYLGRVYHLAGDRPAYVVKKAPTRDSA